MCDRIGISGMYDFIYPYSITYVYAVSSKTEREKAMFIVNIMERCQRDHLYFEYGVSTRVL